MAGHLVGFGSVNRQESRAVAEKPRDAAVTFQHGVRLLSWIQSNWK